MQPVYSTNKCPEERSSVSGLTFGRILVSSKAATASLGESGERTLPLVVRRQSIIVKSVRTMTSRQLRCWKVRKNTKSEQVPAADALS